MFGTGADGERSVWIIAEAGVNHNGDVGLAHSLIDAAAAAGADAVKFQTFDPLLVAAGSAAAAPYQAERGARSQQELLAGLTLPTTAWSELAAHAAGFGLDFLSTAFDAPSLEIILSLGVKLLKAPSGELDNLPYLRELASCGLPLVISTGASNLAEVGLAVEVTSDAPERCLLHCVTAYPAPVEACNLRALVTLQQAFGLPVGWSDHSSGSVTALGAVALGSVLLEKHLTLDNALPGPDHAASADPDAFRSYVTSVRQLTIALGDGVKRPVEAETVNLAHVRRSWHLTRDVPVGQRLAADDVALLRPMGGLPPGTSPVGLVAARDLDRGAPLTAGDVTS